MITPDETFDGAVSEVLSDEGFDRITDDPDDPGGRTKYGITQKLLYNIGLTIQVDTLSEEDAINIYKTYFWNEYKLPWVAEMLPGLAMRIFNFIVTAGPDPAFRCLQRAMRGCGMKLKEDGVMGPQTRGLLKQYLIAPDSRVQEACIIVAYRCECAGYYRDLDKPRFEAGWVERAYRQ